MEVGYFFFFILALNFAFFIIIFNLYIIFEKEINVMAKKKTETNEEIKETSKPTTAKERVKIELDELTERNEKLGNLLGKIKSDNWEAHQKLLNSLNGEQKKLLAKQYITQKKLMHILKRRLEIWTEE